MHGLYDGLYDGLYGLQDGWKVFALPPGKEVLWGVQLSAAPFFFWLPPAGGMCSLNRRAQRPGRHKMTITTFVFFCDVF